MNKLKEYLSASKANIATFAVVTGLIFSVTFGAASAAVAYYGAEVSMYDIGISVIENEVKVSYHDYNSETGVWRKGESKLLQHMLEETDGKLKLDHKYSEELSILNSGTIDEYVRVTIYRYWGDMDSELDDRGLPSEKLLDLDLSLIDLHLLTGSNGWILDEQSSTAERTVLYYQTALPAGETTPLFADTLTIRSANGSGEAVILKTKTETTVNENGTQTTTIVYVYNGAQFVLRVDADGVQTHNAEDAIRSVWGIEMDHFGIH